MNLVGYLILYFLVLSILLYASLAYNPRMWLHRMPPKVIASVPPRTPEERKLLIAVAAPFLGLLVAYPTVYLLQQEADWLAHFWTLCAFWVGFDIWDTLILDLLIFCKLTPRFIIIPGTQRADYAEMTYHLVSGAKGALISLVASAVYATLLSWLQPALV